MGFPLDLSADGSRSPAHLATLRRGCARPAPGWVQQVRDLVDATGVCNELTVCAVSFQFFTAKRDMDVRDPLG